MSPAASVVVVTNRGADALIRACLGSLATGGPSVHTVVVDNSGAPPVATDAYGPGVAHVVRVDNRGFGAGANAGLRIAHAVAPDLPAAVLNDDIEVEPGWIEPLLDALESDDQLGAVQPALVYHASDRVNSLGVELDRYGAGSDIGLDTPRSALSGDLPIEIFTGGAVLFRPAFLRDTGAFDERYFLYYEDVDLALRGAEQGWRYLCVTSSTVRHHGGSTTEAMGARRVAYQERNRLWTAARFGSPALVGRAVWLSIRRLRHDPRGAHARALASGLAGMPGAVIRRPRHRVRHRVSDTE